MIEQVIWQTQSPEETHLLGQRLGHWLKEQEQPMAIILIGDLGAGKTQLSQGIGQGFGIQGTMTSPTFAIVNTYEVDGQFLYHFDLYRLEEEEELENIGFYELTERGKSIIEWGNKFPEALPEEALVLTIEIMDEKTRRFMVTSPIFKMDELKVLGGSYVYRH